MQSTSKIYVYCMFTSPRECGLCTHHIVRYSTGIGLLHLAEWLCPPLPLGPLQTFPSRYAYACT